MPKLTVYVPDDLYDDVMGLPERPNVSSICQRALRDYVRNHTGYWKPGEMDGDI